LDYYSYGFKTLASFDAKKRQTISEDWLRLNRVISDYVEWSGDRSAVLFAGADSQSMQGNPFHRIYRFCKYNPLISPAYFLHTMAALSGDFALRGGVDALGIEDEARMHLEDVLADGQDLKTSDLICFYTEKLAPSLGGDRNKTPNNRLADLNRLGLAECRQTSGAKGGRGDRRWRLPTLTMKALLAAGRQADPDFEDHLRAALEFFSQSALLGEAGVFLQDRLGGEAVSAFRFKHAYFMQALNDFNILDLLCAIEQEKWLRISYRHGTSGAETALLCYPLEIRISSRDGRAFLMYYEPFRRSFTALRIEFIDAIELYADEKVCDVLVNGGYHESKKTISQDIANARKALQHVWGVSTGRHQTGNASAPAAPQAVSVKIAYDPLTEPYIANRLCRERRFGSVDSKEKDSMIFSAAVLDPREMRPWLRSFYCRISDLEGLETDGFSLEGDVESIVRQLLRGKLTEANAAPHETWAIPQKAQSLLGAGEKARAHDLVFHEVFSIYFYIIADVFARISESGGDCAFSKEEIGKIIRAALGKYYLLIGQETENLLPEEIWTLLIEGGFMTKTTRTIPGAYETVRNLAGTGYIRREKTQEVYVPKYICARGMQLYRDVVPLSVLEIRWLKTVLEADKIDLFFTAQEKAALGSFLAQEAAPKLPMDRAVFFDRYLVPEKDAHACAAALRAVLAGIYGQKTLRLTYHKMRGGVLRGAFNPIAVEYSKRNDRFQVYVQALPTEEILTLNLERIREIQVTAQNFDQESAQEALEAYRGQNWASVEVEFYDVRNLADRILTEFSPWKKRCAYEPETQKYTLTIFYQKADETDLVIRLLGYGAGIRITQADHPILLEIQSRMARQMEWIQKRRRVREAEKSGGER